MHKIKSLIPLIVLLFLLFGGNMQVNAASDVEPQILYDETEHYELVEEIYEDIVSNDPNADQALDSLLKTAIEAEKQKSYEWAKSTYQKIIQQYLHPPLVNQIQLDIARMEVLSLLKSQDNAAIKSAVDKLLTNFTNNEDLAEALHNTAFRCRLSNKHDQADRLDGYVTQNWPKSDYALWAQMDKAEFNISLGKMDQAQAELDKLIADFSGHPRLAEAIHHVACNNQQLKKYDVAKQLDEYVIAHWHKSDIALWAQMDIAEINANQGDEEAAVEAVNKLINNFSNHQRLAEALHHIAFHYQQLKQYDQAQQLDEYIIDKWPESDFSLWAQMDIAEFNADRDNAEAAAAAANKLVNDFADHPRLAEALFHVATHYQQKNDMAHQLHKYIADNFSKDLEQTMWSQAEVVKFHIREGNEPAAEAAVNKLVTDFSKQPTLPTSICQIGDTYCIAGELDKSDRLFQYVLDNWSQNEQLIWAKAGLASLDIARGDDTKANQAIDSIMAEYKDYPELSSAVFHVGAQSWDMAMAERQKTNTRPIHDNSIPPALRQGPFLNDKTKSHFAKSQSIWERIIEELPSSSSTAQAYHMVAENHRKFNQDQQAIDYYQAVVNNWPDYQYAWHCQFMIGRIYRDLKRSNTISESDADLMINDAFERLVDNYPDCPPARHAIRWLKNYREKITLQRELKDLSPSQMIDFIENNANKGGQK